MKKVFNFKIRKEDNIIFKGRFVSFDLDIEMELKPNKKNQLCFSCCGHLKSFRNFYSGWGQNLDYAKLVLNNNKLFMTIYKLWKKYHLNDMNSSTPYQEKILKKYSKHYGVNLLNANAYDYACKVLKKANAYVDNNYAYGSGWLYREIEPKDLELIQKLLEA